MVAQMMSRISFIRVPLEPQCAKTGTGGSIGAIVPMLPNKDVDISAKSRQTIGRDTSFRGSRGFVTLCGIDRFRVPARTHMCPGQLTPDCGYQPVKSTLVLVM